MNEVPDVESKDEKKKKPATEVHAWLDWWAGEYKRIHGSYYKIQWNVHVKWVQELFLWAKKEFGNIEFEPKLKETATRYLEEKDAFFKDHNLSRFVKEPHRWVKKEFKRQTESAPVYEPKVYKSEAEVIEEFKEWAVSNPERSISGWALTSGLMKMKNKAMHHLLSSFMVDLVGADRLTMAEADVEENGILKVLP